MALTLDSILYFCTDVLVEFLHTDVPLWSANQSVWTCVGLTPSWDSWAGMWCLYRYPFNPKHMSKNINLHTELGLILLFSLCTNLGTALSTFIIVYLPYIRNKVKWVIYLYCLRILSFKGSSWKYCTLFWRWMSVCGWESSGRQEYAVNWFIGCSRETQLQGINGSCEQLNLYMRKSAIVLHYPSLQGPMWQKLPLWYAKALSTCGTRPSSKLQKVV